MPHVTFPKAPKGTATAERRAKRAKLRTAERKNKSAVRVREQWRCRFPRCGCGRTQPALARHVAHLRHKGQGGNPAGDRSEPAGMINLCSWRHQTAPVSLHAGNIRCVPLTAEGTAGPVSWMIHRKAVFKCLTMAVGFGVLEVVRRSQWLELAREERPGRIEPLEGWQRLVLDSLATMDV